MAKKLISILLTLCILMSFVTTVSVASADEIRNDCITFSSTEEFSLEIHTDYSGYKYYGWEGTVYYSTDKMEWKVWYGFETPAAKTGDNYYLYLYGTTDNTSIVDGGFSFVIQATADVSCTGNIETLRGATGDNPSPTQMTGGCYQKLFYNNMNLISAPELPATILSEGCYAEMFSNCSNLRTAPKLPATQLESRCYESMFENCTSLVSAPELPAMQLAESCYQNMFKNCTSLAETPELPATKLETSCYRSMFSGCNSLTVPADLFHVTQNAEGTCNYMYENATSLKIYTKPKEGYQRKWQINAGAATWAMGMFPDCGDDSVDYPMTGAVYYIKNAFFDVTCAACENGSVSVGATTSCESFKTVTVTPTPDSGYTVDKVYYNDGTDHEITPVSGVYSFTMPEKEVTVRATFVLLHFHDFTYSAQGAALIATCKNTNCGLTDSKVTTTLTVTDKDYTGSAYTGASLDSTAWIAAGLTAPTVKYVGRNGTSYTESETAPTAAGDYTAKITAGTGENTATATAEFTIAKKAVTVSGITAQNKTYDNGTAATLLYTGLSIAGTIGDESLTATATGTFAGANVGNGITVNITNITLADKEGQDCLKNYRLADTGNQESTSANITARTINVSADNKSSFVGSDLVALSYTVDETTPLLGSDTITGSLQTNADKNVVGSYSITNNDLSAGSNYYISFTNGTYTVNAKNAQTLIFVGVENDAVSKTYGDAAFIKTVTGASTAVSYASNNTDVATVNASTGEVTILKAGTAVITATAAEGATHAAASKSYTLTVNRANTTVTIPATVSKYYDGTALTVTATPAVSGATVTYYTCATIDGEYTLYTENEGIPSLVDVGVLYVKAKVAQSENYNEAESDICVMTVNEKIAQTLTFADVENDAVSKTYGDAAFIKTVTGASTAVSYASNNTDVATVNASTGEVTILKAGTAVITATAAEDATHAAANKSYTLTVNRANTSVTIPATVSKYYDGTALTVTATPAVNRATVTYYTCATIDGEYTLYTENEGIPSLVDVGVLYVKAKVAQSENYNEAESDICVMTVNEKIAQTLTFADVENDAVSKTYGDAAFIKTVTGASTAVSYESNNTDVATVNASTGEVTILKAGTAVITATAAEGATHAAASKSYTLTVNRANTSVTIPATVSKVYDGTALTVTATPAVNGSIVTYYTCATIDGEYTLYTENEGIPSLVDVGVLYVKAKVAQSENYNEAESDICVMTVKGSKSTPTIITNPTVSVLKNGQTLGDSVLTGGVADVEGTFTWKTPEAKPGYFDSFFTEYTVIFTPTDTENYNTVEIGVTVCVGNEHIAALCYLLRISMPFIVRIINWLKSDS